MNYSKLLSLAVYCSSKVIKFFLDGSFSSLFYILSLSLSFGRAWASPSCRPLLSSLYDSNSLSKMSWDWRQHGISEFVGFVSSKLLGILAVTWWWVVGVGSMIHGFGLRSSSGWFNLVGFVFMGSSICGFVSLWFVGGFLVFTCGDWWNSGGPIWVWWLWWWCCDGGGWF